MVESPTNPTAPQPVVAPVVNEKKPYPIVVNFEYPEKLSRLTTFFRVLLVIPQSIVLYLIGLVAAVVIFIAWFAILFTGKYPRGMFNYVAGTLRWATRVSAYAYFLTDKYPPFSLSYETATEKRRTYQVLLFLANE